MGGVMLLHCIWTGALVARRTLRGGFSPSVNHVHDQRLRHQPLNEPAGLEQRLRLRLVRTEDEMHDQEDGG